MTNSLDEKKDLASQWFRSLRDQFCASFEELMVGSSKEKNGITKAQGEVR